MGLSQRQYAAHRGVSHTAVAKALATGRISAEPDGTIDPVKADLQWDEATDPAKQRGAHAKELAATMASTTRAATKAVLGMKSVLGTKPVPKAAINAVNDADRSRGGDAAQRARGRAGVRRRRGGCCAVRLCPRTARRSLPRSSRCRMAAG